MYHCGYYIIAVVFIIIIIIIIIIVVVVFVRVKVIFTIKVFMIVIKSSIALLENLLLRDVMHYVCLDN